MVFYQELIFTHSPADPTFVSMILENSVSVKPSVRRAMLTLSTSGLKIMHQPHSCTHKLKTNNSHVGRYEWAPDGWKWDPGQQYHQPRRG